MTNIVQVQVNQSGHSTAEGQARNHKVLIDRPASKGGDNRGAMGGELLLMALGGCFMSNLLAAINAREARISNVKIEIEGVLETAPPHFSTIHVQISADYTDTALMQKLVTISERACIVANTLKRSVDLFIMLQE